MNKRSSENTKSETSEVIYFYAVTSQPIRLVQKKVKLDISIGSAMDKGHYKAPFVKEYTEKLKGIDLQEVLNVFDNQQKIKIFNSKEEAEAYAASLQRHGKTLFGSPIKSSPPICLVTLNKNTELQQITAVVTECHATSRFPMKDEQKLNGKTTEVNYYEVDKSNLKILGTPYFLPEVGMPIIEPKGKISCNIM